jgi:hypothetical protein
MSDQNRTERSDVAAGSEAVPSHDDIARLAYALWQERGDGGSPEQDWLEAEQQLREPRATSQAV